MNQNIVGYYQKIRANAVLHDTFSTCESMEQVAETAIKEGRKLGFHVSKDEALAVGMDTDTFRADATNGGGLNDFELDLIAASLSISCSRGAVQMQGS